MTTQKSPQDWLRFLAAILAAYPDLVKTVSRFYHFLSLEADERFQAGKDISLGNALTKESTVRMMLTDLLQISPARVIEYYGEDLRRDVLGIWLRSVREQASRLTEEYNASIVAGHASRSSSQETAATPASHLVFGDRPMAASKQHDCSHAESLEDPKSCTSACRDSFGAHANRKRSAQAQSCTSRKRARRLDSSEDGDTDEELTTPKRYVRASPKISPQKFCKDIAVLIPSPTIDKSLYIPYLAESPHEHVVADLHHDTSPYTLAEEAHDRLQASEAAGRSEAGVRTRYELLAASPTNELDHESAGRSVALCLSLSGL
jgi:hypothetical protein